MHFIKSRHGPFCALMSIMSKLGGKESPAYWDIFRESLYSPINLRLTGRQKLRQVGPPLS